MSRAFVKELDEQDDKGGPVRPQSPHVNYVTPRGMTLLQDKIRGLAAALDDLRGKEDLASQQSIRELEREMAYYSERVKRAVLIDPEQQSWTESTLARLSKPRIATESASGASLSEKTRRMWRTVASVGCRPWQAP